MRYKLFTLQGGHGDKRCLTKEGGGIFIAQIRPVCGEGGVGRRKEAESTDAQIGTVRIHMTVAHGDGPVLC